MIILSKGIGLIVPKLSAWITFPLTVFLRYYVSLSMMTAIALSLATTGVLLWFIDRESFQQNLTYEPMITKNQFVKRMKEDTFCFISVKYWGIAMVVVGFFLIAWRLILIVK